MEFKLGEVAVSGEGKSFDLFVGPINYEVIAINPTLKELEAVGITWMKQEPDYIKEFSDQKFVEMSVWLKATDEAVNNQIVPLRWLISFDDFVSQGGKTKFIDSTGRTTWAESKSDLVTSNWYTNKDSRPAKKQEEEFYRFINRWLNLNSTIEGASDCRFDIDKWMKGDFSDIKDVFYKSVVPKQVEMGVPYNLYVLTGVSVRENDGKQYHNITAYNKQFYAGSFGLDFVSERFGEYIEKSDFNKFGTDNKPVVYTLGVSKFDPKSVTADEDKGSDMGIFSQDAAPAVAAPSDDQLPF